MADKVENILSKIQTRKLCTISQVKESLISKHKDKTCKENGNSLTQEPVNEDLEEEAKRLFGDCKVRRGAFELGAQFQKYQMMKTAVDGKIYETQARSKLKAATIGKISCLDYRVGDKVKIIIIKED